MSKPTTLAALKRYLKPGVQLLLTEHSSGLPNGPIPRRILKANTQGIEMTAWPGRAHSSWWYFPSAASLTFDDKGFVCDNDPIRMRYEYVEEAGDAAS